MKFVQMEFLKVPNVLILVMKDIIFMGLHHLVVSLEDGTLIFLFVIVSHLISFFR